ncbi:MAG: acyl transferase [Chlorobi bacterium]|nr:acyl transferase [Chlorobiota bacterium]
MRPYSPAEFEAAALDLFRRHYAHNPAYRRFADLIGRRPEEVRTLEDIPFLPVEVFKYHRVIAAPPPYEAVFESSGTTGMVRSRHYVKDLSLYRRSFLRGFELFYGSPSNYLILALLPSYLERKNSSLVYMMNELIRRARPGSGFYLHDTDRLYRGLSEGMERGEKILLFGVSFALLDFAQQYRPRLRNAIVMETGGMKGRRKEPVREELHAALKDAFGTDRIHSEYGMTELLSQAYSPGEGRFRTPPWMKVLIRDPEDPLSYLPAGRTGGINIIDLANVYSCPFIATGDLGRMHADGSFEVLGRFDHSEVRGCNLLTVE